MPEKPKRSRTKWLLAGGAAAAAGLATAAVAVEKAYVKRDRARPDPDAGEPFGTFFGDVIDGVRSIDGTPLHVETWGDGPTIVLSHGYCLNLTLWHYQIADLARDHRVVAFDQRGHGRSGRPTEDHWDLDALAHDLDAVIRAAGDGPAVVMGHSMGGMAAIEFCRDRPEALGPRVAGLVLVDTTAADVMGGMVPGIGRYVQATMGSLRELIMRGLASNVNSVDRVRGRISDFAYVGARFLGFGLDPSPSKVAFLEQCLAQVPSDVAIWLFPAIEGIDISDVLPLIDVPTLVVVGSHDRVTPPGQSHRLAEGIKGAELHVIHGAGHSSMFEKPEEFNKRVRAFLDSIPGWR